MNRRNFLKISLSFDDASTWRLSIDGVGPVPDGWV